MKSLIPQQSCHFSVARENATSRFARRWGERLRKDFALCAADQLLIYPQEEGKKYLKINPGD